jgi:four helix bundle protein
MPTIERFEDLDAWNSARALRRSIYLATRTGRLATDIPLVDQLRRAAVSVGSNIAEGFERGGNRELLQFLSQAKGSAGEIKDQLYCALDEQYIGQEQFDQIYQAADETSRLIGSLMAYLRKSELRGHKFDRLFG